MLPSTGLNPEGVAGYLAGGAVWSQAWSHAWPGLAASALLAFAVWLASLPRRDASLIDRFWPALIAVAGISHAVQWGADDLRTRCMLLLLAIWGLRLAGFLTWRNWGRGEDRRYAQMRARHRGSFAWHSLVWIFGLQAVLAWLVSAPLLAAAQGPSAWGPWDSVGAVLALAGIGIEAVADAQLARFRADPSRRGQVMDRGLWAYSRHPNYFGEACVWWGLGLMACSAGGAWALLSPVLMTGLLLRVSGVSLLEKDMALRRPGYDDYVRRTPAFWPGRPRRGRS